MWSPAWPMRVKRPTVFKETVFLLDFIFAKAELAMEMNATEPVFNDDRSINIRKGRHPLLAGSPR